MTWTRICWRIILILAWVFVEVLLLWGNFRICWGLLLLSSLRLRHHSWLVGNLLLLLWRTVSNTRVWLLTKWIIRVLLLVVAVVLIWVSIRCGKWRFFCLRVYLIAHVYRVIVSGRMLDLSHRRVFPFWLVRLGWRCCSRLAASVEN